MPSKTNLMKGIELIQDTACAKYESSTLEYLIRVVNDIQDDEWQNIIDHLIYAYIKTKGALPTPSQFAQARREVNAGKPTRMVYPEPFSGSELIGYAEWDKGRGRPVSEYREFRRRKNEERRANESRNS